MSFLTKTYSLKYMPNYIQIASKSGNLNSFNGRFILSKNKNLLNITRLSTSFKVEKELQDERSDTKKTFDNIFDNAESISSILQRAIESQKVFHALQALNALRKIKQYKNFTFEDVKKDRNYSKYKELIEKRANTCDALSIIRAIENLESFDVPKDYFLVQSLLNDLLWNVRRASVSHLLHILSFCLRREQKSEKELKILEQAVIALEHRWMEVKYINEFCGIYRFSPQFSANFLVRIDDLIVEASENFSPADLANAMTAICVSKRRPTHVIRSLGLQIFKTNECFTPRQVSDILFSLKCLSFYEENILSKLASDFVAGIQNVNHISIVRTMFICMGQMKWRNTALIDALMSWTLKHNEKLDFSDFSNILLTLASVSYPSEHLQELLNCLTNTFDLGSLKDKNLCVDIVWSLITLGCATNQQISLVLSPSFNKDIPLHDPAYIGLWLKLMTINSAASVAVEGYKGPYLETSPMESLFTTRSRLGYEFQQYVKTVLHNFLPPPKYLRENFKSEMGFIIDAVFLIDNHGKPLCLTDYMESDTGKFHSLPGNSHRIALIVWNFKDFTLGSRILTGQNSLIVKLLKKQGYTVVEIPHFELNKKEKVVKSVQYFEKKIRNAISCTNS